MFFVINTKLSCSELWLCCHAAVSQHSAAARVSTLGLLTWHWEWSIYFPSSLFILSFFLLLISFLFPLFLCLFPSLFFPFQMWAQWRVWHTTGVGICCTGPATQPQPSPATLWIRAVGVLLTGTPWSPCLEMTTRGPLFLTSVKGKSWFTRPIKTICIHHRTWIIPFFF